MQADLILELLKKNIQNPQIELKYTNNFTLLVAVILSAQATDISVNKATLKLFLEYDTPEKILQLGIDSLKNYIKSIGLFNSKANNIIKLSKNLIEEHNSLVPSTFEALIKLPGVGRKSANVVLNTAFGAKTMPVDTHIKRVSFRLGWTLNKDPYKVEQDLLKLIKPDFLNLAHHLLVLHGRYVCKAIKPQCQSCCLNKFCKHYSAQKSK